MPGTFRPPKGRREELLHGYGPAPRARELGWVQNQMTKDQRADDDHHRVHNQFFQDRRHEQEARQNDRFRASNLAHIPYEVEREMYGGEEPVGRPQAYTRAQVSAGRYEERYPLSDDQHRRDRGQYAQMGVGRRDEPYRMDRRYVQDPPHRGQYAQMGVGRREQPYRLHPTYEQELPRRSQYPQTGVGRREQPYGLALRHEQDPQHQGQDLTMDAGHRGERVHSRNERRMSYGNRHNEMSAGRHGQGQPFGGRDDPSVPRDTQRNTYRQEEWYPAQFQDDGRAAHGNQGDNAYLRRERSRDDGRSRRNAQPLDDRDYQESGVVGEMTFNSNRVQGYNADADRHDSRHRGQRPRDHEVLSGHSSHKQRQPKQVMTPTSSSSRRHSRSYFDLEQEVNMLRADIAADGKTSDGTAGQTSPSRAQRPMTGQHRTPSLKNNAKSNRRVTFEATPGEGRASRSTGAQSRTADAPTPRKKADGGRKGSKVRPRRDLGALERQHQARRLSSIRQRSAQLSAEERQQDPYADMFLDIVDWYEREYTVMKDILRPEQDLLHFTVPLERSISQRQLPMLHQVLAILPTPGIDSWADDQLLRWLLQGIQQMEQPQGHYIVDNIASVQSLVNSDLAEKEVHRWWDNVFSDISDTFAMGREPNLIVNDMPSDIQNVHIVYNPSADHWVYLHFRVDRTRRHGTGTLHDSLGGTGDKNHHLVRRILYDMKRLTEVMGSRRDLRWDDVQWKFSVGDSVQQGNSDDCGFFAVDNVRCQIAGIELAPLTEVNDRLRHGRRLRWQALAEVHHDIFGYAPRQPPSDSFERDIFPIVSDPAPSVFLWSLRAAIAQEMQKLKYASVDQLAEALGDIIRQRLEDDNVDVSHKIREVLDGSPDFFVQDTIDNEVVYEPLPGLSVCPDLDMLQAAYSLEDGVASHKRDDMISEFTIRVPVTRNSGNHTSNDRPEKMRERAEALMQAHHARFSARAALPVRVDSPREMRRAVRQQQSCWVGYQREPGTSRNAVFEDDGHSVKDLLKAANEAAGEAGSRARVIFVANGWDGLSTENSSWRSLADRFQNLSLSLTLVVPDSNIARATGRVDESYGCCWHIYDINYLAQLYESQMGSSNSEFHVCPRAELEAALEVLVGSDGYLDTESACSECQDTGLLNPDNHARLLFSEEGGLNFDQVQMFYDHFQLLVSMNLINAHKLDHSIFHPRRENVSAFNPVASALVGGVSRNSLPLPRKVDHVCEVCQQSRDQYVRGTSSEVALRCTDCSDTGVVRERNEEARARDQQQVLSDGSSDSEPRQDASLDQDSEALVVIDIATDDSEEDEIGARALGSSPKAPVANGRSSPYSLRSKNTTQAYAAGAKVTEERADSRKPSTRMRPAAAAEPSTGKRSGAGLPGRRQKSARLSKTTTDGGVDFIKLRAGRNGRDAEYQCRQKCKHTFHSLYPLERHTKAFHNERIKAPFRCAVCDKPFTSVNGLQRCRNDHKRNGATTPFGCKRTTCRFVTSNPADLDKGYCLNCRR